MEQDYGVEVEEHSAVKRKLTDLTDVEVASIVDDGGEAGRREEELCCTPRQCRVDEVLYQTALLFLINMLLFADQNLLAPNLTTIALEFNFTSPDDRDLYIGGYVSIGFFCVGAVASVIAGCIADTTNRIFAMAAVVVIGQGACMGTFFAQTYSTFLALRILTGVSIGGSLPFFYSILGDLYRTSSRGRVMSLATVAMSVGIGTGQILAGLLGPTLGWRVPFLIVSCPAFIFTILLVTTTTEPVRGKKEEVLQAVSDLDDFVYDEKITCDKLKGLCSYPSPTLILCSSLPGSLPWGVVLVYFNDFVVQELHIPTEKATLLVLVYGIGISIGTIIGGFVADKALRRGSKCLALFTAFCFVGGAAPLICILFFTDLTYWAYILICFPSGFIAGVPGGVSRAMLVNVTIPEVRGTAFAILSLADDLGRGLGPFLVSLLILSFPGERTYALAISFSAWVLSALLFLPLAFTFEQDFQHVEYTILQSHLRRNPHHRELLLGIEEEDGSSSLDPLELELTLT